MTTFVFTADGPGTITADVPIIATTTDTPAPVTEDELAEVERLHDEMQVREDDTSSTRVLRVRAQFDEMARTLLPRLAASYRRAEQVIGRIDRERALMSTDLDTLRAAIERVTGRTGTAEQIAADLAATVEALAKTIEDGAVETTRLKERILDAWQDRGNAIAARDRTTAEEERLVTRDHQRLEDRVVQAEAERDRARAVAAQAEALMQDREKMWRDIRDLIAAISPIRDGAPLTKEAGARIDNAIAQAMRRPGTSTDEGDRTT